MNGYARGELRSADLDAAYRELWEGTAAHDAQPVLEPERCVVWNNLSSKHVDSAVEKCGANSLGRVALQRGGGALSSVSELVEQHPGRLHLFIVQRGSDEVVARGRIARLSRRAMMTPEELREAHTLRLATDDEIDADYVLIASDVVRCEPSLDIRSFVKCSNDEPLKPRGRWPASICYLPPDVVPTAGIVGAEDVGDELEQFPEGEARTRMVKHRRRERRLRDKKIREAIRLTGGVRCEVAACGFDFLLAYGEVGREYGQVHHLAPLATTEGTVLTGLGDLAILCANCHAMVHRRGASRSLDEISAMLKAGVGA